MRVHGVRHPGPSGRLAALVDERGERSFVTERGAADLAPAGRGEVDLAARDRCPSRARLLALRGTHRRCGRLGLPAWLTSAVPSSASTCPRRVRCSPSASAAPGLGSRAWRPTSSSPTATKRRRSSAGPGRRAWSGLLDHAPLAVVKDGAWGCRVMWREEAGGTLRQLDVAAQRLTGLDSTGAGDGFAAGFLHAFVRAGGASRGSRDLALRQAALAGHKAAALAMRRGRPELLGR